MKKYDLPTFYSSLTPAAKRLVREQYVSEQNGMCMFCNMALSGPPSADVKSKKVNWKLFPPNFTKYPIHLQHDHSTDLTEGAVHALCNAVMWQYHGR